VCFYAGCAFKRDIGYLFAEQISEITAIPKNVLLGSSLLHCNVAQRMSWASTRKTTREEDMAYCLMGPFDVQMPPIYGEGSEKAFLRLQEEILKRSSDQTLFLWTPSHEPYNQGLLATSPRAFCTHYDCFSWLMDVTDVRTISQNGFSPYSFFRPTSSAASTQTFNTQRPEYHFGDQDSNDGASWLANIAALIHRRSRVWHQIPTANNNFIRCFCRSRRVSYQDCPYFGTGRRDGLYQ
jgi:hypothetical protein